MNKENFDYIGELKDTWRIYREHLDSTEDDSYVTKPTYIGETNEEGNELYGIIIEEHDESLLDDMFIKPFE